MVLFVLLVIFHVIVCLVLVGVILLQAGKGGGLTDTFGGGATQNILGSRAGDFLSKATAVCAIVFLVTSLGLALFSSYRSKSLLEQERMLMRLQQMQKQLQEKQAAEGKAAAEKPAQEETTEPVAKSKTE